MSEDKRDINLDELKKVNGGYIVDGFLRPDGTLVQIPLKQHAVSDRTACCSASSGTE